MKKVVALFIVCTFLLVPASVFGAEKVSVRVAHAIARDSHYQAGLEHLGKLLADLSGGRIELQIFHSAQLGSELDALDLVSAGSIEMTLITSAPLSRITNAFAVFDLPFIIQDRHKAYAWMDGPEGSELLDSVIDKGLVALGIWENGFRMLTNSVKPVLVPDDLKGLKIRLMENPIHVATFRTLGAESFPMPFGELFAALQQRVIDGQENPLVIISTSNFAEVQKHLSLTGHFYAPAVLLINKDFWDNALTEEQREIFAKAELDARHWQRAYSIEIEQALRDSLKDQGMEIVEPDRGKFFEAVQPVYAEFEERIGKEAIQRLIEAQR